MTQTTETTAAYAEGVVRASEQQAGREHCAALPEPDRNVLYWERYRHLEGRHWFAQGFCAEFREIGRRARR